MTFENRRGYVEGMKGLKNIKLSSLVSAMFSMAERG